MKSVTIGIPAFNEEANIAFLLQDILSQRQDGFMLEKIIVISDGSTDATVARVRACHDTRIECIDDGLRRGQAERQNEIISRTTSDILVLLNADISLEGSDCIAQMVRPIADGTADLVGASVVVVTPRTFLERVLEASLLFKDRLFRQIRDGQNIYTCSGRARAFSRRFLSRLHFTESVGEDAYSYLFCIAHGFHYQFVDQAVVAYKLPETLTDHVRQSERFFHSRERFYDVFGKAFVEQEYQIPGSMVMRAFVTGNISHWGWLLCYGGLFLGIRIQSWFSVPTDNLWAISESSKNLHREGKIH